MKQSTIEILYGNYPIRSCLDMRSHWKNTLSDEALIHTISQTIKDHNMSVEVIHLQEDKISPLNIPKSNNLPKLVKHFLYYSELRGIDYYVLKTQEDVYAIFVAVFGASAGRENDYYMKQIIELPDIKKVTTHTTIKLSELLT